MELFFSGSINGLYSPSLNLYVPCLFHSISMQVMYHGRHVLYFCALAREQNELASEPSRASLLAHLYNEPIHANTLMSEPSYNEPSWLDV